MSARSPKPYSNLEDTFHYLFRLQGGKTGSEPTQIQNQNHLLGFVFGVSPTPSAKAKEHFGMASEKLIRRIEIVLAKLMV